VSGKEETVNSGDWRGRDLGTRTEAYAETDAILYALAVGAKATDLDLVFEERLRVLPTFALTRAQWAPDVPRSGELEMKARVSEVWDKGGAAVFEVAVDTEYLEATWSIFAPGCGGFGGERGPSAARRPEREPDHEFTLATGTEQAALYRLLGDRHHMHIDPEAARAAGMPRPFMHGLCTLAAVTLPLAGLADAHPADLLELDGRFASPVFPGDVLEVSAWNEDDGALLFEAAVDGKTVLSAGRVLFGTSK